MSDSKSISEDARPKPPALVPGMTFLVIGLLLAGEARQPDFPGALLYDLAGVLFVTTAAFLASAMVALTHNGASDQLTNTSKRRSKRSEPAPAHAYRRWRAKAARLRDVVSGSQLSGESLAILTTLALSCLGLLMLSKGWRMADAISAPLQAPFAGALIALVFPILVLERHLPNIPQQIQPDSAMLARLCRVPMLALLGLGLATSARWLDFPAVATLIERTIVVITALVGLELSLRSVAGWYGARAPAGARRCYADSTIAGLLEFATPGFRQPQRRRKPPARYRSDT